jgi:hypothetical protein
VHRPSCVGPSDHCNVAVELSDQTKSESRLQLVEGAVGAMGPTLHLHDLADRTLHTRKRYLSIHLSVDESVAARTRHRRDRRLTDGRPYRRRVPKCDGR